MKLHLTLDILNFLVNEGYKYCLSATKVVGKKNPIVQIYLTPVVKKPLLRKLPSGFDTYFSLNREPWQMAAGIDSGTKVMVILNQEDIMRLKKQLIAKHKPGIGHLKISYLQDQR